MIQSLKGLLVQSTGIKCKGQNRMLQMILLLSSGFFLLISVMDFIFHQMGYELMVTVKKRLTLAVSFVFVLGALALASNPIVQTDLNSHIYGMQLIRKSGCTFWDILTNPPVEYIYKDLLTFNVFRYILTKISTNDMILPWATVMITYSIWVYIFIDLSRIYNQKKFIDAVTCSICFSTAPFLFILSGIRNGLAASIMGLAVYLFVYKKKKLVVLILLTLTAIFIHQSVVLILPFAICARYGYERMGLIIALCTGWGTRLIAPILTRMSNTYLRRIGYLFIRYTGDEAYRSSRYLLYGDWVYIICILLMWIVLDKRKLKSGASNLYAVIYLIATYVVCICGFAGLYDMILRPMYTVGILSPCIGIVFAQKKYWKKKWAWCRQVISSVCVCVGIYMIIKILIDYLHTMV